MDYFADVKKNFGFGCMRLPMKDGEFDKDEMCRMVDVFLKSGFNYFDTAHGYLGGKSETALRECPIRRYPRESYILTNKLTNFFFKKQEDIRLFFESQLKACGVEYFDIYLMHAQGADNFAYFKKHHAYETALELMAEGKFRHFGISFHDRAEVLEQILAEYPQIKVVQIQFNYVDYDDPAMESRKCYEVCRKFGKPIIVMEPVKGGNLVKLPENAKAVLDGLQDGSPASYAIRLAAGFDGVMMVFPCTACRYCVAGCPKQIAIPDLFAVMNTKQIYHDWNADYYYNVVHTGGGKAKASECIKCGKCEKACPQHQQGDGTDPEISQNIWVQNIGCN